MGRFGSYQMVGTTLDDREDYMELQRDNRERPKTTDDPGRFFQVILSLQDILGCMGVNELKLN